MVPKTWTLFLSLLVSIAFVVAQDSTEPSATSTAPVGEPTLSTCEDTCLTTDCVLTDIACICGDQTAILACVSDPAAGCTAADLTDAQAFFAANCAATTTTAATATATTTAATRSTTRSTTIATPATSTRPTTTSTLRVSTTPATLTPAAASPSSTVSASGTSVATTNTRVTSGALVLAFVALLGTLVL